VKSVCLKGQKYWLIPTPARVYSLLFQAELIGLQLQGNHLRL